MREWMRAFAAVAMCGVMQVWGVSDADACSPPPEDYVDPCPEPDVYVVSPQGERDRLHFDGKDLVFNPMYTSRDIRLRVRTARAPDKRSCAWKMAVDSQAVAYDFEEVDGAYELVPDGGFRPDTLYSVAVPYECDGELTQHVYSFKTTANGDDGMDMTPDVSISAPHTLEAAPLYARSVMIEDFCGTYQTSWLSSEELEPIKMSTIMVAYHAPLLPGEQGVQTIEVVDTGSGRVLRRKQGVHRGEMYVYAACDPLPAELHQKTLTLSAESGLENEFSHWDVVGFAQPAPTTLIVRHIIERGRFAKPEVHEVEVDVDLSCSELPVTWDELDYEDFERQRSVDPIYGGDFVPVECSALAGRGACAQAPGHGTGLSWPWSMTWLLILGACGVRRRGDRCR